MPRIKKGSIRFEGGRLVFDPGVFPELKKIFWDKDVEAEITKMNQYLAFKDYKDYVRFVGGWLMRARERSYSKQYEKKVEQDRYRTGPKSEPRLISEIFEGLKPK